MIEKDWKPNDFEYKDKIFILAGKEGFDWSQLLVYQEGVDIPKGLNVRLMVKVIGLQDLHCESRNWLSEKL